MRRNIPLKSKAKDNIAPDSPLRWYFTLVLPRTKHVLNAHWRAPVLNGWGTCGMNCELRSDCLCTVQRQSWNPDCGIFSWKNCKSALNFSKTATEQNELIEMQYINSNYTVSFWIKLSLPLCCRQKHWCSERHPWVIAHLTVADVKISITAYVKHPMVPSKQSSRRVWKREERKEGRSMEAATNLLPPSHALNHHPGVCGWAGKPGRACATGRERTAGLFPAAPSAAQARRAAWLGVERKKEIEVKCPEDTISGGKLCFNSPAVCGLSLLLY